MKNVFGFILLALLAVSVPSCKRCTQCNRVDHLYSMADSVVTVQDFCGSPREVNQFKEDWEAQSLYLKKAAGHYYVKSSCTDQ